MKTDHRPGLNRVLVKPAAPRSVIVAGMVVDDVLVPEKKAEGTVIAVGSGEHTESLGVKKGDICIYGEYQGEPVTVDGKEYIILFVSPDSENEVLLIK